MRRCAIAIATRDQRHSTAQDKHGLYRSLACHKPLGRASEASLAPDRACGRGRTERVRNVLRHNYRHKRERGAVAFKLMA